MTVVRFYDQNGEQRQGVALMPHLVATVKHSQGRTGTIWVGETLKILVPGVETTATVQRVSPDQDVDLALVETPLTLEPVELAPEKPKPGDTVVIDTYLETLFRTCSGHWSDKLLAIEGESRPGDSGSPVFNPQGKLVGILTIGIWLNGRRLIGAVNADTIRTFLNERSGVVEER